MNTPLDDEELTLEIARHLEIDHRYVRHFDPWQTDEIDAVRRCGRRAARALKWKVRTFQTDPGFRSDGRVVVIVAIVESTAEDERRLAARLPLVIEGVLKRLPDHGEMS